MSSTAHAASGNNLEEESLDGSGVFARSTGVNLDAGADGSFKYSYELELPTGKNGLAPSLSLGYNSNNTSDHTRFGQGWDVSIPRIERYGRTGVNNLYGSTTPFTSTFSGELVRTGVTSEYNSKIETGDFYTYTFENNQWIAYDKAGTRYSFGSTTSSRQANESGTKVYAWYLDEIRDASDNYISYSYVLDDGILYPTEITYTGHGSIDGIFSIQFSTSSANSQVTTYEMGFPATRNYLIDDIDIYENGIKVKNYSFTYDTLSQSERDVLTNISETGYSQNVVTTLPDVEFTYSSGGSSNWSVDTTYEDTFPEGVTQTSGSYRDNGTRMVDINGDGLVDMVRFYQVADYDDNHFYTIKRVHINEGSGEWDVDVDWEWDDVTLPFTLLEDGWSTGFNQYWDMGTRFSDVNGDGLVDLVVGLSCATNGNCHDDQFEIDYINTERSVYLNTGSGWERANSWSGMPAFSYWNIDSERMNNLGWDLADVDGDGLPDLIRSQWTNSSTSLQENIESSVWYNTGSGWEEDVSMVDSFPAPLSYSSGSSGGLGTHILDVNGDGLVDVIRSYDHEIGESDPQIDDESVYLNTGDGWERNSIYSNSLPSGYAMYLNSVSGSDDQGYRFIDVNSDGFVDIVRADGDSSDVVYWNTGYDFSTASSYSVPQDFIDDAYDPGDRGVRSIDMNGDTLPDLVFAPKTGTTTGTGDLYVNQRSHPVLLTKVDTKEGGTITIDYDGYQATQLGSIENMGRVPFTPVVVTSVEYDSGFGNQWTQSFEYEDAYFYYDENNVTDRRFAGFGQVTQTTDLGETTTYYHQGNGTNASSSELVDGYALIGLPYRSEVADLSGNIYAVTRTNWATTSLSASSTFVKKASEVTLQYDGDGDHKDTAVAYTYDNSNGAVLTQTEYGEVTGVLNGTFTDTGTDKRITTYTYATNTAGVVVPATETVTNNASIKVRESKYYYDNQSLGTVTDGNMTKQEDWVTGSTYVDTEWTYNNYGLPTTVIDPNNNVTTYAYDQFNLFVASTTDAEGNVMSYEYDYSSGKVATTTDANGQIWVTRYDGLGRPTHEYIPNPATGSSVLKSLYTYTDTSGAVSVQQTNYLDGSVEQDHYTYLDGFGNVIQERAESETSSYIAKDYIYGSTGLLVAESLPYFNAGSSRTATTTNGDLYTEYAYDALKRIIAATTTVGTTYTAYDQWTETVTDPLGNDKDFTYDAYGRLAQVAEHNSASEYDTVYTYDANNNLTKITDALGNVRNVAYDGLSRRTSLEDLHDTTDTSYGTWTFSYDAASNLTQQVDPNGNTTNYTYDDINRILTEDYTGDAGTEVVYAYDSCTRGAGKLCAVSNTSATTTYTYDYAGNTASEARTIAGTTYTTEYDYDRLGNQTLITYPDNSEVRYTYNDGNQIETIEQRESGGSFTDVISDFDYGPHGQVTYQLHGNGSETTKTYDADELYRLRSIVTTASSTYGTGGPGEELQLLEQELFVTDPAPEPLVESTTLDVTEEAPETIVEEVEEDFSESDVATTSVQVESDSTLIATSTSSLVTSTTSSTTTPESATTTTPGIASDSLDDRVSFSLNLGTSTPELPPAATSQSTQPSIETKSSKPAHIKNAHDARAWQRFHEQRAAAYLGTFGSSSPQYQSAKQSADAFGDTLMNHGYIDAPGQTVKESILGLLLQSVGQYTSATLAALLPETVYAYVFGAEDFESCSSIPCSFDTDISWGSVTPSLDSSGKITGDDTLKETVTGEGGGSLRSEDHDRDEIWIQFKLAVPSSGTWGASGYYSILEFRDPSDTIVSWLSLENWGSIARLTMAGDELSWTNTGIDLPLGQTSTIELRFKTGTSTGDVDIWVDNDTENSPDYDGNGTMDTGLDTVNDVLMGVTYAPEAIATNYLDDMIIDYEFIGSNGATTSGTNMLDNHSFENGLADWGTWDNTSGASTTIDCAAATDGSCSHKVVLPAAAHAYWEVQSYQQIAVTGNQEYTLQFDAKASESRDMTVVLSQNHSPWEQLSEEYTTSLTTAWDTYTHTFTASSTDINSVLLFYWGGDGTVWVDNVSLATSTSGSGGAGGTATTSVVYDDDLQGGWEDWSWGGTYNGNSTEEVYAGSESIKATYTSAYGALYLHEYDFDTSGFDSLDFAIYFDSGSGIDFNVGAVDNDTSTTLGTVDLHDYLSGGTYTQDTWHEVSIPLADLNYEDFSGETSFYFESTAAPTVVAFIDSIQFIGATSTSGGGGSGTSTPTFPIFREVVQDLTYTYDAVGNITQIVDNSDTDTAATTTYAYDDLYRLTNASTTQASTTPYTRTYTYNALGNILTKSDQGTYTYSETNYANPHAVTEIETTSGPNLTFTYDSNGNMTSGGAWTYGWDYKNRLISAGNGLSSTTYAYDFENKRVRKTVDGVDTIYPSNFFEVSDTGTSTKHIYVGEMLVASIEDDTPAPKVYYNHLDHLNSTRAVTDSTGYLVSELEFYPFGDTRIDNEYGDFRQDIQHTGHRKDNSTSLIYRKARYYDGATGRFNSMDPYVFKDLTTIIHDPQLLNTYGYARNNPLIYDDPNGELPALAPIAVLAIRAALIGAGFGFVEQGAGDVITTVATGETHVSSGGEYAKSAFVGGVTGGTAARYGGKAAVGAFTTLNLMSNVSSQSENPIAETALDTTLMVTGAKYVDGLRKVPGRDVSTFSDRFFTGAHTQEALRNAAIETGVSSAGRAMTVGSGVFINSSGMVEYTSTEIGTAESTPERIERKDKNR